MTCRNFLPQIILIIACLFVSCTKDDELIEPANDRYLSIPDARFEAILIKQGIDSDGALNQQMLKKDAEGVTVLNLEAVAGENTIQDLTGIEGFIQLQKLSVVQHDIQSLDLSANIMLDTLYLMGNNISTLDISKNPQLILVDLSSNVLSSLTGVANAIRLKELKLSFNDLEEFSLPNSSIESLLISHNLLKSLDVRGALSLKNILLKSNEITALDLSSNRLLETLVLSDNQIEQISLEQNRKLTHLFLSANVLTHLDVSELQELTHLTVQGNLNLSCVKIQEGQNIPTVSKSDTQELSNSCD